MARDCVVVVATTLVGFRIVARALAREGCGVQWTDTMGTRVYDYVGAVS